ncbi:MAG UNVERIFIED_CONTAM: hypothetical protein LVR29_34755 [Microcystis novacekii LVE1205-3]
MPITDVDLARRNLLAKALAMCRRSRSARDSHPAVPQYFANRSVVLTGEDFQSAPSMRPELRERPPTNGTESDRRLPLSHIAVQQSGSSEPHDPYPAILSEKACLLVLGQLKRHSAENPIANFSRQRQGQGSVP